MTKKGDTSVEIRKSRKVGRKVDNVKCEIEGVVSALQLLVERCRADRGSGQCYILTDCQSAVDVVVNQKDCHHRLEVFKSICSSPAILANLFFMF